VSTPAQAQTSQMQSALAQFQQYATQHPAAFRQQFPALAAQAQAQSQGQESFMPWTQSQRQ
jgi:hypothetical protein